MTGLFWLAFVCGNDALLELKWEKNMLTIRGDSIPGESIPINYIEAYCRRGSTHRDWRLTTIPHRTELLSASPTQLELRCQVGFDVTIDHVITSTADEVTFRLTATNRGNDEVDVDWAQPCMRLHAFTGRKQDDYYARCFLFTDRGLTSLDATQRGTKALYVPGQVYIPQGVNRDDVNPRPHSRELPVNGLIGAFSADDRKIVAMAWDSTQELFQGVIVCIHSDFRIGGLRPRETKRLLGKIYILDNDVDELVRRYRRDFGSRTVPKP